MVVVPKVVVPKMIQVSDSPIKAQSLTEKKVRAVIQRTLVTYPRLSVTMLGNHVRPFDLRWREVLEKMVEDKEVVRLVEKVDRRFVFIYVLPENVDGYRAPSLAS